jgi:hypothetical protein
MMFMYAGLISHFHGEGQGQQIYYEAGEGELSNLRSPSVGVPGCGGVEATGALVDTCPNFTCM